MPFYILNREQIRNYDRIAAEKYGVITTILMENAGRGAAQVVAKYAKTKDDYVVIVCGAGNNGGDGFVVARYLVNRGINVVAFVVLEEEKIKGDAKYNLEILKKLGVNIRFNSRIDNEVLGIINRSCVIVDALFGTGLNKEVASPFREWIEAINKSNKPVVSLDIPSGVDADSGKILGEGVNATETVTFGTLKTGLLLFPGAEKVGKKLYVATIGVPDEAVINNTGYTAILIDEHLVIGKIRKRRRDSHKGDYGHLMVLAGSPGKTGAPLLAGEGAIKVGVGLVTIVTSKETQNLIDPKLREIMSDSFIDSFYSEFGEVNKKKLKQLLEHKSAIALGPGLGIDGSVKDIIEFILQETSLPMVIDADGLNIISKYPEIIKNYKGKGLVLTPHPGEMARLSGMTSKEVQQNRIFVALEQANRFNAVVVLKGAHTLIATPEGKLFITISGNPGMATGGMGDVLTGMIGGFLAQGYPLVDSAVIAVFLHALTGDKLVKKIGMLSLTPSDILHELGTILKCWEKGEISGEFDMIETIF